MIRTYCPEKRFATFLNMDSCMLVQSGLGELKQPIIHIRTRHVSFSILIGRNSVAEWLIVASMYHLNSDPK
jgi:hypothetical protein